MEDPINSREFNLAMESQRQVLDRLERSQEALSNDIKQLYELHRNCLFAQSEKAFHAGRISEKMAALGARTKDLEDEHTANRGHKRQLGVGIILTAMAAVASLMTTLLTRK